MQSSPMNKIELLVTKSATPATRTASTATTTTSKTDNLRTSGNFVSQRFLKITLPKHSPWRDMADQKLSKSSISSEQNIL